MAVSRHPKRTIRNIQDYQKATGSYSFTDLKNLRLVKSFIMKNLHNQKSKLHDYLSQLSYERKIDFTVALIMNDEEKIGDYLLAGVERSPKDEQLLKYLRYAAISSTTEKDNMWLSNTACRLILSVLYRPDKITKMNSEERKEFLSAVMGRIPESFLSLQAKREIGMQIDKSQVHLRVAYNESLQPMTQQKDSGKISLKEYKIATKIANLDMSEFIFLTLGVLHKLLNDNAEANLEVNEIRQLYINGDLDEAYQRLWVFSFEHQEEIDPNIFSAIQEVAPKLENIDINTNYSRRFFENRLAAIFAGRNLELDVINHIIAHIKGSSFAPVTTNVNAMQALADLSELSSNTLLKRMMELQKYSSNWRHRGRVYKPGITSKSHEASGELSDSIYTRNLGVMKSLQPNYNDELSQQPIRNASVDINTVSSDPTTYPHGRSGAYTASISGHAYFMVAILEKYITEDTHNLNMEFDINSFIKSFAISFVGRGFHGLNEVLDVFKEPHIIDIFKSKDIHLNFDWANDLLKTAFNETQSYTKNICLRKRMHEELLQTTSITEVIKNENLPLLKRLIKGGAVELDAALRVAATDGKANVVKFLLTQGADVNVLNDIPKSMDTSQLPNPQLKATSDQLLFKKRHVSNEDEPASKKSKKGKMTEDDKAAQDLLNFLNKLNKP